MTACEEVSKAAARTYPLSRRGEGPDTQVGVSLLMLISPILWMVSALSQFLIAPDAIAGWRYFAVIAFVAVAWTAALGSALNWVAVTEGVLAVTCIFNVAGGVLCWYLAPGNISSLYVIISLVPSLQLAINLRSVRAFYFVALWGVVGATLLILWAGLDWLQTLLIFIMIGVPYAVANWHLRNTMFDVRRQADELERLSRHDPLTGALNRRGMRDGLAKRREMGLPEVPVWCVLLDLDHFKKINDVEGHDAGDAVLVEVANTLREQLRGPELLARTGGEEFCIITSSEGSELAERIRASIQNTNVRGINRKLTVSVGVIGPISSHVVQPDEVWSYIDMADAALYRAKALGRNRVEVGTIVPEMVEPRGLPAEPEPDAALVREHLGRRRMLPGAHAIIASVFSVMFMLSTLKATTTDAVIHPILPLGMMFFAMTSLLLTHFENRKLWRDLVMLASYDLVVVFFSLITADVMGRIAVVILLPAVIISTKIMPRAWNIAHNVALVCLSVFMFTVPGTTAVYEGIFYGIMAGVMLCGVSMIVQVYAEFDAIVGARLLTATLRDPLTGAYNRRGLEYHYGMLPAGRHTLAVIDVDQFKTLNDARGHAYGDAALHALAQGMEREFGSASLVSRIGGDEFVLVTQRSVPPGIERVTHDLHASEFKFSVSVGRVDFDTSSSRALWDLVREADQRLLGRRDVNVPRENNR